LIRSKLRSKDILNISCIVESSARNSNLPKQENRKIITYVPAKDVYKAGVGSGLLGLSLGAGAYALHNKLSNTADKTAEHINSLHEKLTNNETSQSLHDKLSRATTDEAREYINSLREKLANIINPNHES